MSYKIYIGSDPELFFKKDGKIIGSEKVIPPKTIVKHPDNDNVEDYYTRTHIEDTNMCIVRDGIQVEMNTRPNKCIANAVNDIRLMIKTLRKTIPNDVEICFDEVVDITQEEMKSLSSESKQFGCMPSYNAYKDNPIPVKDASKYFIRSAGGHIHIGGINEDDVAFIKENHIKFVKLLDYLLGNTCVLLDRNERNVERRKVYGRAGEFRLPKHGLEYRTLSNFWLKKAELCHFVFEIARETFVLLKQGKADEILKLVPEKNITEAINTNNYNLAMRNFALISKWLEKNVDGSSVLAKDKLDAVLYLAEGGLHDFLDKDTTKYWMKSSECHRNGFLEWAQDASTKIKSTIKKNIKKPIK